MTKEAYEAKGAETFRGIFKNGPIKPVRTRDVPEGARVFGSRFIGEIKRSEQGFREKSRFVAQNYFDLGAANISTNAPTEQLFSQRLVMTITASMNEGKPFARDINQAYVKAVTNLKRGSS